MTNLLKLTISIVILLGLMGTNDVSHAMSENEMFSNEYESSISKVIASRKQEEIEGEDSANSAPLNGRFQAEDISLPTELMAYIFLFLDKVIDVVSIYNATKVCCLWRQVLKDTLKTDDMPLIHQFRPQISIRPMLAEPYPIGTDKKVRTTPLPGHKKRRVIKRPC